MDTNRHECFQLRQSRHCNGARLSPAAAAKKVRARADLSDASLRPHALRVGSLALEGADGSSAAPTGRNPFHGVRDPRPSAGKSTDAVKRVLTGDRGTLGRGAMAMYGVIGA